MQINYVSGRGITVTPQGLFDYCAGHECIPIIEQLVEEHRDAQVTVDFSETQFVDSSGIGALIALQRKLPYDAPRIKLKSPSSTVQKLLEICHLDRLFEIDSGAA